jgi:hypothetical protein
MQDEQIPDWARQLRDGAPPDDDVLSDLRGQVAGTPFEQKTSRSGLAGVIGGLVPWQRFTLALLLFLNTALLGCMCLVMAGRVVPFR